jgi:uncharacterized protein YyaL (SSP411 family)
MGLIELYLTTREKGWLEQAADIQVIMDKDFWDHGQGGYFLSVDWQQEDANALPVRPKELYDGAMPSANSIALNNLVGLGALTGNRQWKERAREQLQAFAGSVRAQPMAYTHTLNGWQAGIAPIDQHAL